MSDEGGANVLIIAAETYSGVMATGPQGAAGSILTTEGASRVVMLDSSGNIVAILD